MVHFHSFPPDFNVRMHQTRPAISPDALLHLYNKSASVRPDRIWKDIRKSNSQTLWLSNVMFWREPYFPIVSRASHIVMSGGLEFPIMLRESSECFPGYVYILHVGRMLPIGSFLARVNVVSRDWSRHQIGPVSAVHLQSPGSSCSLNVCPTVYTIGQNS